MAEPWQVSLPASALGKFVGKDTLLKVLTTASLRWSRPGTFNDPFDCQPRFKVTPASEELIEECVNELKKVFDGSEPTLSLTNPLGRLSGMMAEAIRLGTLVQEDVEEEFRRGVQETLTGREGLLRRHHEQVVLGLQDVKVLCLTKAFESILMWSHYAENHSGALLLFAPLSGNSTFSLAQPVVYSDDPIEFVDHALLPKQLTGQASIISSKCVQSEIEKIILTKSASWSYEQEWRIFAGSGFKPDEEAEFNGFSADDVVAVVFGARYPNEEISPFVRVASEYYPKVKWFRAQLSTTDMRLWIAEYA
jgi:hypothetical protein